MFDLPLLYSIPFSVLGGLCGGGVGVVFAVGLSVVADLSPPAQRPARFGVLRCADTGWTMEL